MTKSAHSELGDRGEQIAAEHLQRRGYRILARRYRCPGGEIDLVARRKRTIVFVEVKARSGDAWADPEDAVDLKRQRRLVRAAGHYLATRGRGQRLSWRFDVIAVLEPPGGPPTVRHTEDACDPTQVPRAGSTP